MGSFMNLLLDHFEFQPDSESTEVSSEIESCSIRPKRPLESSSSPSSPIGCMRKAKALQLVIDDKDRECANSILEVQKKYDAERDPLLTERDELLSKIPGFWASVLTRGHPTFAEYCSNEIDKVVLNSIESVVLRDNLDDNGSHEFRFKVLKNKYFNDQLITKNYTFFSDGSEQVRTSEVSRLVTMDLTDAPFTRWLCEGDRFEAGSPGEIIRRDVWQNPLAYHSKLKNL
jgi:hypothetical protein